MRVHDPQVLALIETKIRGRRADRVVKSSASA